MNIIYENERKSSRKLNFMKNQKQKQNDLNSTNVNEMESKLTADQRRFSTLSKNIYLQVQSYLFDYRGFNQCNVRH